jgi:transcriptional regulator with XRE-family HTH domain
MRMILDHNETQAALALIVETQYRLRILMVEKGTTKAELAKKMGVSKSRISQLFGDYGNITLETLACAFHALGETAEVTSPTLQRLLDEGEYRTVSLPPNSAPDSSARLEAHAAAPADVDWSSALLPPDEAGNDNFLANAA